MPNKKENQKETFMKSTKKKKDKQKETKDKFGKYNSKSVRIQIQSMENRKNHQNDDKEKDIKPK